MNKDHQNCIEHYRGYHLTMTPFRSLEHTPYHKNAQVLGFPDGGGQAFYVNIQVGADAHEVVIAEHQRRAVHELKLLIDKDGLCTAPT